MPHALHFLVLALAGWVNRHQENLIDSLREENRVRREHLGPRPLRLTDAQRRRLAGRGQTLGRRILSQVAGIVTPDTILRWYRRLIAQKYEGSARRRRGRPMTPRAVTELVVRMAGENPTWGDTRIRGALANLGHHIARNTVKRILHDHGLAPAPERNQRTPWKTFLQTHGEGLAAADLFTVEVLTLAGLRRYFVFFVIELKTRRVHITGIHPQPDGRWMEQMARNLTDPENLHRPGACARYLRRVLDESLPTRAQRVDLLATPAHVRHGFHRRPVAAAHSPCLSRPPERMWMDGRVPWPPPRRDPAHAPARDRLDHYPR